MGMNEDKFYFLCDCSPRQQHIVVDRSDEDRDWREKRQWMDVGCGNCGSYITTIAWDKSNFYAMLRLDEHEKLATAIVYLKDENDRLEAENKTLRRKMKLRKNKSNSRGRG